VDPAQVVKQIEKRKRKQLEAEGERDEEVSALVRLQRRANVAAGGDCEGYDDNDGVGFPALCHPPPRELSSRYCFSSSARLRGTLVRCARACATPAPLRGRACALHFPAAARWWVFPGVHLAASVLAFLRELSESRDGYPEEDQRDACPAATAPWPAVGSLALDHPLISAISCDFGNCSCLARFVGGAFGSAC
jgi:hypothetical protein